MKFFIAGIVTVAAGIAVLQTAAQAPQSAQPAQQQPAASQTQLPGSQLPGPQLPGPQPPGPQLPGQVVFSRTRNSNGQTTTTVGPAASPSASQTTAPVATDAEREAVAFTAYDMDVHLDSAARHIAVRALLTVRNDGAAPLSRIPLQISSSLTWDRIRVEGRDVAFPVATLNSDADHTGQLHEAAVPLAAPLAPGHAMHLDVTYAGDIAPNAQRLLGVGTPGDAAIHSDWDGIGVDFTGLRGFGNVVWYPVSSVPEMLGDGARLFDEIGRHELRLTGASFSLRLTDEFPHGQAPTVAVICGHSVPIDVTTAGGPNLPGVATASLDGDALGFETPSLFVAVRDHHPGPDMNLWTLPADDGATLSWTAAANTVLPFLKSWLGDRPRTDLTLLDLPDPGDAPFEEGAFLVTGIRAGPVDRLDGILAHALTQAFIQSPRAWLSEGVAGFMGTLWIERQRGREQALSSLEASRQALALIEPASPGENSGEPLAEAYAPIYYRTKAAYVLWMLRGLTGDAALSAALRAYNPATDTGVPGVPCPLEKLLEQAGGGNLSWFFADWVKADHGLPDLSIDSVFPGAAEGGNWLVAVDLSNTGYAAAEVPLTVRSSVTSITRQVMIPARAKTVERILIQGKPTQVQLNDGSVPEVEASIHVTTLDGSTSSSSSGSQPGAPQ
ncbi:MAG: hypothetical protein ACRD3N_12155 [Terracidiphilus sp.]